MVNECPALAKRSKYKAALEAACEKEKLNHKYKKR